MTESPRLVLLLPDTAFFASQCQRHLTPAVHKVIEAGMLIYKILRSDEWSAMVSDGETAGAPIDLTDGYIHFSTAAQARETAAKHFADEDDLVLLAVDADAAGDTLAWEPSRGGQLFPHLYRKLLMSDVIWFRDLPLVDGLHAFPPEMV